MSYSLLPLDELTPFSVKQAANDLSFEFGVHNNKSLGYDFAPELEALKQKPDDLYRTLMQEANNYAPGKFERYIISTTVIGEESERQRAIGVASLSLHTEEQCPELWGPNASMILSYDFRGKKIGQLTINTMLDSVAAHHEGRAWTAIAKRNIQGLAFAQKMGFTIAFSGLWRGNRAHFLSYDAKDSRPQNVQKGVVSP